MHHPIDRAFNCERINDVMLDKPEIWRPQEIVHVDRGPGQKIIDTNNGMSFPQQPLGKVGTDEACDSC